MASGLFDRIVVSTDDQEIMDTAMRYGADVIQRTPALARDEVGTQEVMRDALSRLPGHDHACCIYAAAPLLQWFDLAAGFALLPGHPYAYVPGIYYWGQVDAFLCEAPLSAGFEVPYPAGRYIDINTPEDWARAQTMYAALYKRVA